MKTQKIAALIALVFFVGAGLVALLNVKDREQGIVTSRAKLQSECVKICTPPFSRAC